MSVPATAAPAASAAESDAPSSGQAGANPAPEQRADPTPASSAEAQEQVTRGPDYFRQAFQAVRGQRQPAAAPPSESSAASPAPQAPPASSGPARETERSEAKPSTSATTLPAAQQRSSTPQTPPADRITLTPAELDRRIQSEADRKLAKQQADEKARRERELEVELRRTNPWEYAQLMEDREKQLEESRKETDRLGGLLTSQLNQYDRNILDPLVGALPEALRKEVIAPDEGIEGRKKTAAAALKALKQQWVNEGRQTARSALMQDQTFIKEVLARYGGSSPEPEAVRAAPPSTPVPVGQSGMNAWMRSEARSTRRS